MYIYIHPNWQTNYYINPFPRLCHWTWQHDPWSKWILQFENILVHVAFHFSHLQVRKCMQGTKKRQLQAPHPAPPESKTPSPRPSRDIFTQSIPSSLAAALLQTLPVQSGPPWVRDAHTPSTWPAMCSGTTAAGWPAPSSAAGQTATPAKVWAQPQTWRPLTRGPRTLPPLPPPPPPPPSLAYCLQLTAKVSTLLFHWNWSPQVWIMDQASPAFLQWTRRSQRRRRPRGTGPLLSPSCRLSPGPAGCTTTKRISRVRISRLACRGMFTTS